jgi:hypothetical protein
MNEINPDQRGALRADSSAVGQNSVKVHWTLFLAPLAGIIALGAAVIAFRPLDDKLIWWVGGVLCAISYALTNTAWKKARAGGDVRSFFPVTMWLALGCLFVPMALFLNGALDRSPIEQHHQVVTRTILGHGRHGSIYYSLEFTSWRPNRAHEKVSVSKRLYLEAKPGDPVTVETHRGALGIPMLASIHSTN